MLKIAICDDDQYICSSLELIILEYKKHVNLKIEIEVFSRGEDLIRFIKDEHHFDLIFLDIELEDTTGIAVGTKIRHELDDYISKIVFISSKDGYDRQLFAVQPLNFIKKPFDRPQIIKSIELAAKILNREDSYFEYTFQKAIKKVNCKNIVYFQSMRKKIILCTLDGEDQFYGRLNDLKNKLPNCFISPHNSYLINFSYVSCIAKNELHMVNGDKIPISQKNFKSIREFFINVEKEKRNAKL